MNEMQGKTIYDYTQFDAVWRISYEWWKDM